MKIRLNYFSYQPTFVMKKYFALVLIGFILGMLTYFFLSFTEQQESKLWWLAGFLGSTIACMIHFFNDQFNRLISWKIHTGFRLLSGILSNMVFIFIFICIALFGYFYFQNLQISFVEYYHNTLLKLLILIFFISLVYNVIYFTIHSYNQYVKGQIAELQLERKQTELQLAALKSQLSPHFLFNNINTVSSLLFSDIKKAELFIRELAKSYIYTLNKYKAKWVTVKEELQFVNSYYFLLKTRFNKRINLNVSIPEQILETKIPPLTLQMLVENSVKHNQMNTSEKLEVAIFYENDSIIVSNNKTVKPKRVDSFGIGLSNIKLRYKLLANRSVEVIDQTSFMVKLPVVL